MAGWAGPGGLGGLEDAVVEDVGFVLHGTEQNSILLLVREHCEQRCKFYLLRLDRN